jgi:cytochrome P450
MGTRIQMRSLKFLFRDKKWWEAIKISHDFAYTYVDKALAFRKRYLESKVLEKVSEPEDDEKHRYVLLEEMAKETDDRDYLRSQIVHIFIAGHDSTAITVGHVFFLLSRHPEVYEKLHAEVNALDEAFTFESLKSMHYLQYVIKESELKVELSRIYVYLHRTALRLHPVTPLDSRIAMQDTILPTGGGPNGDSPIFVPKDSLVTTSLHSLHRLSPVFQPDPDSFRPERWETVRPGWNYLPFFGGPRICPGRQLALTEAAYVVARMVQEFRRMECRDPVKEWVEEFKITASSRNGTKVALFKD